MSMNFPYKIIKGTGQNLTIGAASVASVAFGPNTYAIEVSATGNCHIAINQVPVALATDRLIKASDPAVSIGCSPGDKLAVIQDGASTGTINLVELTH